MSASPNLVLLLGVAAACAIVPAAGAEEDIPDTEFLEYLGLWDESDEDWLVLDKDAVAENEERNEPVPQGEDSMEAEDES